ncbi:MAG: hypothetical protein ACPIOQ_49675, partial [Promethearchaeia archaeon]
RGRLRGDACTYIFMCECTYLHTHGPGRRAATRSSLQCCDAWRNFVIKKQFTPRPEPWLRRCCCGRWG